MHRLGPAYQLSHSKGCLFTAADKESSHHYKQTYTQKYTNTLYYLSGNVSSHFSKKKTLLHLNFPDNVVKATTLEYIRSSKIAVK